MVIIVQVQARMSNLTASRILLSKCTLELLEAEAQLVLGSIR